MPSKPYDLFVIGTGLAGSDVAEACAQAGWHVGIADHWPFGGTCPLRGCDPKKVLVHAAHVADQARRLDGHGLVGTEALHIDWGDLMAFKRTFTRGVPEGTEERYAEAGIDTYHGAARFTGPRTLAVGKETIEAKHVLIATGAEPVELGIDGEEHFTHSDDFLETDALPERLVFVGGGYISMEFAHLAARAGAREVTVLEMAPRLLPTFEADVVQTLTDATEALGVRVCTECDVNAIEKENGAFAVVAETEAGKTERYEADAVVHGAGRVPQLDALDLGAAGIERSEDGLLKLDEHLRSTSNPHVYAAGDAAQRGKPLTPVAHLDGRVVEKALLEDGETPNYEGTPTIVFTTPRLASVGLTEAEAREQGLDIEVKSGDASDFYTARHRRQEHASYKVVVEETSGKIAGAHLAYPHAEEAINVFALAVRRGLTVNQLKAGVYTYPSATSDLQHMLP